MGPKPKPNPNPKPEPNPEPNPNPNPNPNPKPCPNCCCVTLYGSKGFAGAPLVKTCDGIAELEKFYFYGVKFPEKKCPNCPNCPDCPHCKNLSVRAFPWQDCGGNYNIHIDKSTEFIERDGHKVYSASMAFRKEAKLGCIDFFCKSCLIGKPCSQVCGNIADTKNANMTQLNNAQSILPGLGVHRISFFTEPNYNGFEIAIEGNKALYNIGMNWRLGNLMRKGKIRSI